MQRLMEKKNFTADTRYTVTLKDDSRKLRPANIYVFRLHNDFMIVRMIDGDGLLRKIRYADVAKIVKIIPVPAENRFFVPDAILSAKMWTNRTQMEGYSSSPGAGK